MAAAALALLLAAGEAPPGCAVIDPGLAGIGSHAADLARTAELAGFLPLRPQLFLRPSSERPLALCPGGAPAGAQAEVPGQGAEWSLVPPTSFSTLHTGWSDDRNDGALFGGRGLSAELSAGVRVRWTWLTAQLAPLASWQENRSFPVPPAAFAGYSPYANPYNGGAIDLPLRMGPRAFSTFDLGQSFVRADAFGLAAGLSTENLWWGPGVRNSLLMSNSAAGFPHFFLGTARPADIWIGRLEAQLLWGHLAESRWFDFDPSNDTRLFEGFTLGFEPAIAPGLFLGYARVFLFPSTNVSVHHYFDPIVTSASLSIRKPHPRIFLEAARLMDLPPAACAYVGDTVSRDVVGARRAGYGLAIQITSFLTGKSDRETDTEAPDALIRDLREVVDLVTGTREESLRGKPS